MAAQSSIEWTDATWTPIRARNIKTGKVGWHCEHATTGCEFCYAEGMNKRLGTGLPFKPGHLADVEIFLDEKMLLAPLRWKTPRKIFVCSMTDLFARFVPDAMIDKMFAVMALASQHEFQVCTKRADRMREYMAHVEREAKWMNAVADLFETNPELMNRCYPIMGQRAPWLPLPNVWLGVSAERQPEWDERKEHLRLTPAAVRFASFEPLLGPIVEPRPMSDFIQWAIVGGESGSRARPMLLTWAQSLRDQCAAAGVPFFFKQWGEWIDADEWAAHIERGPSRLFVDDREWRPARPLNYTDAARLAALTGRATFEHHSDGSTLIRVGKAAAGRLLDGVAHNGFPGVRS